MSILFKKAAFVFLAAALICLPSISHASGSDEDAVNPKNSLYASLVQNDDDLQELNQLLNILDEETKIATKTKMNKDYVPGMVTVLRGEQLEALGIRTVAEALGLVPGIQLTYKPNGLPSVIVRGISFPFNSGNIKVMLNSVSLSRESSGINLSVLLIPIAQVERVEIIRGPGSVIYGDFAESGVVNIITNSNSGRVYGSFMGEDSFAGGGYYYYEDAEKDFKMGFNLSTVKDRDTSGAISSDPDDERLLGVYSLRYKGFSLIAQGVFRDMTNTVAESRPGPPSPGPPSAPRIEIENKQTEDTWVIEARQLISFSNDTDIEFFVSGLHNSIDASTTDNDHFEGDRITIGFDLTFNPVDKHNFLIGYSYSESDIDSADNGNPALAGLTLKNIERRSKAVTLQDQISLTKKLTATLGLRYDDFDDVGDIVTKRVAAAYNITDRHIIKAQYSDGFRPPTFWEMYQQNSQGVGFEKNKTAELAYIYSSPDATGRLTLYSTRYTDVLYAVNSGLEEGIVMKSKGVEAEWEQKLNEKLRFNANMSYGDFQDERNESFGTDESLASADIMGNFYMFYQPAEKYMLAGRAQYIGKRHTLNDSDNGYKIFDLTLTRYDLFTENMTLRTGIKNLLDEKVEYMHQAPNRLIRSEVSERSYWVELSYRF